MVYDFRFCSFQCELWKGDRKGLRSHGEPFFSSSLPHSELEILCVDDWLGSTHTDSHAGAGLSLRFYKPHQFFIIGYPQGSLRTSASMERGWKRRILSYDSTDWMSARDHSYMQDSHTMWREKGIYSFSSAQRLLNWAVVWNKRSLYILDRDGQTWWSSNQHIQHIRKGVYLCLHLQTPNRASESITLLINHLYYW